MAPRDTETSENYKKCQITDEPLDPEDFTPVILHKKHKVVKLVESQLRKIRSEGLVCCDDNKQNPQLTTRGLVRGKRDTKQDEAITIPDSQPTQQNRRRPLLRMLLFIVKLLFLLLLILLVAWIAAGPLSNKSPHTPISLWNSLITTDNSCELERKYLLRWSVSE